MTVNDNKLVASTRSTMPQAYALANAHAELLCRANDFKLNAEILCECNGTTSCANFCGKAVVNLNVLT